AATRRTATPKSLRRVTQAASPRDTPQRFSPAAALLIIGANAVEKISEAERADRAGLSRRLVLAHLPRLLRADGRAHRAPDEQPRAGHAGRLRLHEHAAQAPRRRAPALHRRRLRVRRPDLPARVERRLQGAPR